MVYKHTRGKSQSADTGNGKRKGWKCKLIPVVHHEQLQLRDIVHHKLLELIGEVVPG
jgi:hypothetical protein